MPKIYRTGDVAYDRYVYRLQCACGCVADFNLSEVRGDQRDGDYIVCPTCKKFVSIKAACVARVKEGAPL